MHKRRLIRKHFSGGMMGGTMSMSSLMGGLAGSPMSAGSPVGGSIANVAQQNGGFSTTPVISSISAGALQQNAAGSKGFMSNMGNKLFGEGGFGGSSAMSAYGAIGNTLNAVIPSADKTMNSNDAMAGAIRGKANSMMMSSGNPFMMAAAAINMGIEKTGGFTDASKGLGGKNDTLNMISSLALPGAGWFTKKAETYKKSQDLATSSGYTGTSKTGDKAAGMSGGKFLFGGSRANAMIREAKRKDNLVQDILGENRDAFAGASAKSENLLARNNLAMSGGYDQSLMRAAKSGMKITDRLGEVRETLKRIQHLKDGGSFNVIPDGALHARKHEIELEDITSKGIPVITLENGEVIQHAEIEINEIIFCKEVTSELEKLYKDGSDEAAIEAGKLIAKQIMTNTLDKTGLIKELCED